jgi:hypothetical protein
MWSRKFAAASARPLDRSRQSSRRLGIRRRRSTGRPDRPDGRSQVHRQIGQARLAAAPHLGVQRAGTGRSRGCWAPPNGPRQHAAELKAKAVLYVNSDTNGRGFLQAEGSHAMQHFVSEVARDVKDPETGASVLARALAERHVSSLDSPRGRFRLAAQRECPRFAARSAWVQVRTTRPSCSTWASTP